MWSEAACEPFLAVPVCFRSPRCLEGHKSSKGVDDMPRGWSDEPDAKVFGWDVCGDTHARVRLSHQQAFEDVAAEADTGGFPRNVEKDSTYTFDAGVKVSSVDVIKPSFSPAVNAFDFGESVTKLVLADAAGPEVSPVAHEAASVSPETSPDAFVKCDDVNKKVAFSTESPMIWSPGSLSDGDARAPLAQGLVCHASPTQPEHTVHLRTTYTAPGFFENCRKLECRVA